MGVSNLFKKAVVAAMLVVTCVANAAEAEAEEGNPEVEIATSPLYNGRANVHPNMLLSLSVEFPTVGAAYRGTKYDRNTEYIGYFNPTKCYLYNGSNRNPAEDANLHFYVSKNADDLHECGGDSFSGNFMNWASASAIDMLRYALTGGDRIVDTETETVLQRAVLRDSPAGNFYAHSTYFPRKTIGGDGSTSQPKDVTPFNVNTLYIVSCRNRILFSDSSSGVSGSSGREYCVSQWDGSGDVPDNARDKKLGEYFVRVKVCDSSEATERKELCARYQTGYKPVGEIQKRADKLRIGAMGYLLDDSPTRYGGVLRAPLKYVGAKKIDNSSFSEAVNDKPEWDPRTGVFYNNPDSPAARDIASNSGVINYLNKFGRSGIYKGLDPVGELYYEGLRYFQGKQPTPEAINVVTDAMKDEFPVIEQWEDPVIASCQRNYIVTIADVNTHWDRYIPGNSRTTLKDGSAANDSARAAENEVPGKTPALDVRTWTRLVGDMESDPTGAYTNPSKNTALTGLDGKDTGSGGHGTYYMAGLAYWANTHDIRLDKPTRVKTFAIDVDEGGNGKIDGSNRALKPRDSQLYLAAKYGGFDPRTADNNPFITLSLEGNRVTGSYAPWSDGNDPSAVPSNYFLAGQPKEMIQSIRKVFSVIGEWSGTTSNVSTSTNRLSTDGAYVYQPGFDPSKWSGSLRKLKLTLGENGSIHIDAQPVWDAGMLLTGNDSQPGVPAPSDRSIFTSKFDSQGSISTDQFKWTALTDEQQALLNTSPATGAADENGEQRVAFLRGERDKEQNKSGGIFRVRDSILGDIINSNTVYVGAPATNIAGDEYLDFFTMHEARTHTIYVGANDGMLHAFAASDGRELFAYVPNALIGKLAALTMPDYQHSPYVDGTIAVAEARVGRTWKTVLASGMGGGAQGVFALDVTDPSDFESGSGAIFEFTDADDPDMGNVIGAPVIAKFKTGSTGGVPTYKYFVVVSSGLNNYKDDGASRFNTDAASALFLLSLDKQPSAKWQVGVNYYKFRVPSSDSALKNGLSTPALVSDASGSVRYAYAGDLQGNLWRFDFTGDAPWSNALSGSEPLFVAKSGDVRQPITMQPRVVFGPAGGYVVLFGTGKFVEAKDVESVNFGVQSFYGIADSLKPEYKISGRSELAERTLAKDGSALKISGAAVAYGWDDDGTKGWYFDFLDAAQTGERSVTNPLVRNGLLFFNTLIPGSDPCLSGGGRSYILDTLSGLPAGGGVTGHLSTVGMLSTPMALETVAEIGDRNAIGRRGVRKKYAIANFGTGGASTGAEKSVGTSAGRLSWREILNWQELRDAFSTR